MYCPLIVAWDPVIAATLEILGAHESLVRALLDDIKQQLVHVVSVDAAGHTEPFQERYGIKGSPIAASIKSSCCRNSLARITALSTSHTRSSHSDMKPEYSIQAIEARASETLFPELREHLSYVNDSYNLAFKVQESMGEKRIADISNEARAQFMILMPYCSKTEFGNR